MSQSPAAIETVIPGSILTCSRCGHKWAVRKRGTPPKNCPRCRSTLWMKNYRVYTCMKCNHSWGTANDNPLRCPKCHTSKWNTPVVPADPFFELVESKLDPERKAIVLSRYDAGDGCIKISIETGIPFSEVIDTVMEKHPRENARL